MDMADKVRENRVRRAAERQGLRLVKSRRRDPNAWDHGTYGLLSAETGALVWGVAGTNYGVPLDDVEHEITKPGGWWEST